MDATERATPLSNAEIANRLGQLARLLRHQGANRFKIRAYQTAGQALQRYPARISELVAKGIPLPKIPGIGASIGSAIEEIVRTGTLASIDRLGQSLAPGTAVLAQAASISVRDAQRLAKALKVQSPEELRTKLNTGQLGAAVGPRLEFQVRQALDGVRRLLWDDARELSEHFQSALSEAKGVSRVEAAGSLRRGRETVGSIRFLVGASDRAPVHRLLRTHGGIGSVTEESASRFVCTLPAGPRLIVRITDPRSWGNALVEETGSERHLKEVQRAVPAGPRRTFATEESWYGARKLPWIPPELREGRGEVQAALGNSLPKLVVFGDIRGDLHSHTTASDGADTLADMVRAARARGYEYLAITDHSKSLKITNGLDERRLAAQGDAIDRLNSKTKGFRVFKGSEVDILEDGTLDFQDATLRKLDFVIASIHSRFGLDKAQQTERLVRAVRNPYLTCLGHLTGRKLLRRPGYQLDLERVLKAVKRHGKLLEINASPDRLDIDDTIALRARQLEIPLLINTDAHSVREFDFMSFGVRQARRGWQSTDSVLNTLPLAHLVKRLKGIRTGSRQ